MRFRRLAVLPLLVAAAFLVGDWLLHEGPAHAVFLRTEIALVKTLSLIGSLAAALRFEPGAYLRRAWLWSASCMAMLLLADLTRVPVRWEELGIDIVLVRSILTVLANAAQVVGTWMLARAWRVAELSLPGPRWGQAGVALAAVVVAAALAGPPLAANADDLLAGDPGALAGVASALGDAVALCLIAPLLLTALALRGGLLGWPWSLLTTSYFAWLLFDAAFVIGSPLGFRSSTLDVFRTLGCMYGFSAGMAQRFVVDQLRHRRATPTT